MGVFRHQRGGSILISNHENNGDEPFRVPAETEPGLTYDALAPGGTSTIVVDRDGDRLDAYTSLAGTSTNCAGGITPWKTWLTCEEVEARADDATLDKDHGYVFEVDPRSKQANRGKSPIPLKFLGRYAHEAVAVDPDRNVVYLTEDATDPERSLLPLATAPRLRRRKGRPPPTGPGTWRRDRRPAAGDVVLPGQPAHPGPVDRDRGRHRLRRPLGRRAGPGREDHLRSESVRQRSDHPVPQTRGSVVGQRRRLLRGQLRPQTKSAPSHPTTVRSGSTTPSDEP